MIFTSCLEYCPYSFMEFQMLSRNNEDEFNSLECYSLFVIETRIPIRVLIKFAPFSLPSARLQTTPALYMMRFVKRASSAKENSCLLVWHISNLSLMAVNKIFMAVLSAIVLHTKDCFFNAQLIYYYSVLNLVGTTMDIFVDVFLILLVLRLAYRRDNDIARCEK